MQFGYFAFNILKISFIVEDSPQSAGHCKTYISAIIFSFVTIFSGVLQKFKRSLLAPVYPRAQS
jgi:hypothetical protein